MTPVLQVESVDKKDCTGDEHGQVLIDVAFHLGGKRIRRYDGPLGPGNGRDWGSKAGKGITRFVKRSGSDRL